MNSVAQHAIHDSPPSEDNLAAHRSFITLTGVDDSTPLEALWELAGRAPGLVEFGVLYSHTQQGSGRYPSFPWIERLAKLLEVAKTEPNRPRFALHICGRAAYDFLVAMPPITQIASAFDRVQVNFKAYTVPTAIIHRCIQRCGPQTIITQHNRANQDLWTQMKGLPNHAVLFDASGGQGLSPEDWPVPLPNVACGYAGDLGPDNLSFELEKIHAAAGGRNFWCDMEGKLRDEQDRFNIGRARLCIDAAHAFHRQYLETPPAPCVEAAPGGAKQQPSLDLAPVGAPAPADAQSTLSAVASLLENHRFRFSCEQDLQDGIETVLNGHGISFKREYVLTAADRPDFFLEGGIVIEVKVDGTLMQALRQVSRYANHADVTGALLVGTPRWLPEVPASLNEKPVRGLRLLGSML